VVVIRVPFAPFFPRKGTSLNAPYAVGFLHPIESLMLPVLHLDPVLRPASLIRPIAMSRDKALESELASLAKQIRPNLSLLKGAEENPLKPASEQPGKIGFPHR
jgi:hypothetical protein